MQDTTGREWVTATQASKVLGCPFQAIRRLAAGGHLTSRRLPGCDPLYLAADVARLAEVSTRPATKSGAASAAPPPPRP